MLAVLAVLVVLRVPVVPGSWNWVGSDHTYVECKDEYLQVANSETMLVQMDEPSDQYHGENKILEQGPREIENDMAPFPNRLLVLCPLGVFF